MNIKRFYELVEDNESLTGVGITNGSVVVHNKKYKLTFGVPIVVIKNCDEKELIDVITCKRSNSPLIYMSRVVGYFSSIKDWNPSKVSEWHDRRKGGYAIEAN